MQICNAHIFFGTPYGLLKTSELTHDNGFHKDDIIVFGIHIPDYVPIIEDLSTFLGINEKKRALNYYKEKDKNRFIICRSLLKLALSYYTESTIKDISIKLLPNKKPYLFKHPNTYFNVSHSGDYAVLALSTMPLGIDLEYVNTNYSFQDILPFIFSDNEIRLINNADNKVNTFYSLWTRKESVVKALGIGIDNGFKNIPCLDGIHPLNAKVNLPSITHWHAMDFQIGSNYQGSLVYSANNKEPRNVQPFHFPTDLSKLLKILAA